MRSLLPLLPAGKPAENAGKTGNIARKSGRDGMY